MEAHFSQQGPDLVKKVFWQDKAIENQQLVDDNK